MAGEDLQLISLKDDFYRDGYYKALIAIGILLGAIALLVSTSIYLQLSKPPPVAFKTGDEFRTLLPVPVTEPYLSQPNLIQWVSEALPRAFTLDFINYNEEVKSASQYFTVNGWKNFLDQLKMYAEYNTTMAGKLFITAVPGGAPFIINQGLLPSNSYGWLVQMPINLGYSSVNKGNSLLLIMQALVVRIPTTNNLTGVAIEKITVTKGAGDQIISNE
ncbi:MAG TPA: DotI/IcmL/TraM family protein [Gammaproteobacteria bacterium]|nr:DotI/IcmL/TraM family protein [Gammaproteobacteria bacterium]